jgi:hypothetical protein
MPALATGVAASGITAAAANMLAAAPTLRDKRFRFAAR